MDKACFLTSSSTSITCNASRVLTELLVVLVSIVFIGYLQLSPMPECLREGAHVESQQPIILPEVPDRLLE
jgi:hypothetical protein